MSRWTELARHLGAVCLSWFARAAARTPVTPIQVPEEISGSTPLELSGIVWSNALSRYVVVSDDVVAAGRKHAPLLFTISRAGQMDRAPLGIVGVTSLNDLESITAGPGDSVFICTSYSQGRRGQRQASRRRLLQLALAPGRPAQVLGQIDLTSARPSEGTPSWEASGSLDIEALAYRQGALYLGLKAPLGADGSATILRLEGAAAALKAGVVPAGGLSVWSRSRFCIERHQRSVCQGIADLTFLADGRLLVVANSPKGMPSDGGGSLWQLEQPNQAPELLERFAGLKPEGVALTPDGASAVLVFDRGDKAPVWASFRLSP